MMDVQKKMTVDMLHGSMAGPMVIFALPLALTGVLQQLFNTADTLVLGQFVGTDALAAVRNQRCPGNQMIRKCLQNAVVLRILL